MTSFFLFNLYSFIFFFFFPSSNFLIPRVLLSSRIAHLQLLVLRGSFWRLFSINVELLRCVRSLSITIFFFINRHLWKNTLALGFGGFSSKSTSNIETHN